MAVVLDSDAVIGFLDRDDALHPAADAEVRELASEQALLASVVTYAEVLTCTRQVEGFFADLLSAIVAVDIEVASLAADLRARAPKLRMPDALILATGQAHPDVNLIITGDETMASVPDLGVELRLLRA